MLKSKWIIIVLASFAWVQANANEIEFAALRKFAAIYEFMDGTQVAVQTSGDINRDYGLGVLVLKKFEIKLSEHSISPERFKKIISDLLGVKLETIQIFREPEGLFPDEVKITYTLSFDYLADAFGSARPASWENRKKMSIFFDKDGIQKVISSDGPSLDSQKEASNGQRASPLEK